MNRSLTVVLVTTAALIWGASTFEAPHSRYIPLSAPTPTPSASPRVSGSASETIPHVEACSSPLQCVPVDGPIAIVTATPQPLPYAARVIPFTRSELLQALDAVGWPVEERDAFTAIITDCENIGMNAGAINDESPSGAYGAAQLWLGWFNYVHIDPSRWWVLEDNIRAALGARNYSVEHGIRPFAQWACAAS